METINTNYDISENIQGDIEAKPPKSMQKHNNTITFIENELYETLNYLNNQLALIDDQTLGDAKDGIMPFNRNVFESKKQIVEQKIFTLRLLSSISTEQVKLTAKVKDESEISSITELFAD